MSAHCLVNVTKGRGALHTNVRGGLLLLLTAWSMALKGAELYLLKGAEGLYG